MGIASPIGSIALFALVLVMPGCMHSGGVVRSQPPPLEPGWLAISGHDVRGTDYEVSLPLSRLAATPAWTMEGRKEPALLPGKAVWLARRAFAGEFPDSAWWRIEYVSIETYPQTVQDNTSPIRDRPYYEVGFVPPEYASTGGDHYPVWVLMDGTVVLPHPWKPFAVESGPAPNTVSPPR